METGKIFTRAFPISFRILNADYEEKIYFENKPSSGLLELTNDSGEEIYFMPSPNPEKIAGPDNFHFALKFRPGILKSDAKSLFRHKLIKKGWAVSIGLLSLESDDVVPHFDLSSIEIEQTLEESTPVLYFLNLDKASLDPDEKIILPLTELKLQCDEGTQVTQVELFCNKLSTDRSYKQLIKSHTRHFNLSIIDHRGNPHMPIYVGFAGFNAILNDGVSSNSLTLRITNLQKKTPENNGIFTFSSRKHSRMYLYFDTDSEPGDYALGTVNNISQIELNIIHPIQKDDSYLVHEPMFQGDTPVWEIYPEDGDVILQPHLTKLDNENSSGLPDDSCFDIVLSEILTDFLMGTTKLHLRFENIPGYWDNTFSIPIVKQPLVFKTVDEEERVGIGTINPANKLTVKGNADFTGNVSIGKDKPATELDVNGTITASELNIDGTIAASDYQLTGLGHNGPVPKGLIAMWYGDLKTIPFGWALCNGENGTPDLRDRFVIGGGGKYEPRAVGGRDSITLTENELPSHNHSITIYGAGEHSHEAYIDSKSGGEYGDHASIWHDDDGGSEQISDGTANGFLPTNSTGNHNHKALIDYTGSGNSFSILPPYMALAYIMKI